MASVISNTIILDKGTQDRRIAFRIILEDNENNQETIDIGPIVADATFDADAAVIQAGINALESKLSGEDSDQESLAEDGEALSRALNPRWSTTKRIAKRLIRWMMRERDPRIVIMLEPLINYIQQNYNANQIANLLDISTQQVLRLNRRVNAILTDTGTVKAQLLVFDGEQEDIE